MLCVVGHLWLIEYTGVVSNVNPFSLNITDMSQKSLMMNLLMREMFVLL